MGGDPPLKDEEAGWARGSLGLGVSDDVLSRGGVDLPGNRASKQRPPFLNEMQST